MLTSSIEDPDGSVPHPATRRTRWRALAAAVLTAGAALVATASPAAATAPTQAVTAQGWARFGHFAPSVAAVDVTVDGQPFATGVAFKGASPYLPLDAGVHRFELRASGEPDTAPLLSIEAAVPADGAVTVGAVTSLDGVAPQVFDDALATPAPGAASVRFIHAAPEVAAVDVQVVDGPVIAANVPYAGAIPYQPVPPGQYDVDVRPAGSSDVLLHVDGWSIDPGTQASIVFVRGADGTLDVAPLVDSAATTATPVGGVQTGYGSMADALATRDGGDDALATTPALLAAIAAAAGLLGTGALVVRRRAAASCR